MENFTDFSSINSAASGFVKMALDEYYADQNWTNLVINYWTVIDEKLGGEEFLP